MLLNNDDQTTDETAYITLKENSDGQVIVSVSRLGDTWRNVLGVEWPANERGFVMAGRHAWILSGQHGYSHSSTLDFPGEYGLELDADDIHALIVQGIEEASEDE